MDNKKKIIIIGLASAILVIGGIVTYIIIKPKKEEEDGTKKDDSLGGGTSTNPIKTTTTTNEEIGSNTKVPSTDSVIKVGAKGKRVGYLQLLLNYVFSAGLDVDGSYGDKTKAAVKKHLGYICLVGSCEVSAEDLTKLAAKANNSSPEFKAYLNSNAGWKNVMAKYE